MAFCAPDGTFVLFFTQAFEDFFWLHDPNVSCSPPSFDLKSPAFVLNVLVDVEKLVEAR
jgi:hypothetical protein